MARIFVLAFLWLLVLNQPPLPGQNSLYNVLVISDDDSGTPETIYNDVQSLGFNAGFKHADSVTTELLSNFHAVILSCGRNENSCTYQNLRSALDDYVTNLRGGVIVEGGNTGYNTAVYPTYPAFRNKIMKVLNWNGDDGGNLTMNSEHAASPLVNYPNKILPAIGLEYKSAPDQDMCTVTPGTQILYSTDRNNNNAGILAYPDVNKPEIVNLLFNYTIAANRENLKKLLENILFNLIQNTISIKQINQNVPVNFKLYQNFPNPFNPDTKIRFNLSEPSFVKLEIFDAAGRLIDVALNQFIQPGEYVLTFPSIRSRNPGSGIYYYVMRANDHIEKMKMVLIK